MADLILTEATVAERGETTSSYGTRCCTKARAEALGCTVTEPANATDNQLITGAKGNLPNLAVSMAGWTYGGTAKSPSVSGNTGGGTVTYTYKAAGASSYTSTKPTDAGTYTVKATVAATTNYISKSVTTTFTIAKATPTLTWSKLPDYILVGEKGTLKATTSSDGSITYKSGTTTTATISSATVTGKAEGTSTITATVAATTNYNSKSITYTLHVDGTEYVDLGLPSGKKWAWCNVGATNEYTPGNYYMYGKGSTKYSSSASAYTGIENPLSLSKDTARVVMGNAWRTPTLSEWQELLDNTTQSTGYINNYPVRLFTNSKGTLSIPLGGMYDTSGTLYKKNTANYIWLSTPYSLLEHDNAYAGYQYLYDEYFSRKCGMNIRGIHEITYI